MRRQRCSRYDLPTLPPVSNAPPRARYPYLLFLPRKPEIKATSRQKSPSLLLPYVKHAPRNSGPSSDSKRKHP